METRYTLVFERNGSSWTGFVEEQPTTSVVGSSLEETRIRLEAALQIDPAPAQPLSPESAEDHPRRLQLRQQHQPGP